MDWLTLRAHMMQRRGFVGFWPAGPWLPPDRHLLLPALVGPRVAESIPTVVIAAPASQLMPWFVRPQTPGLRRGVSPPKARELVKAIAAGGAPLLGVLTGSLRERTAWPIERDTDLTHLALHEDPIVCVDGSLRLDAVAQVLDSDAWQLASELRLVVQVVIGADPELDRRLFEQINGHVRRASIDPEGAGRSAEALAVVDALAAIPGGVWEERLSSSASGRRRIGRPLVSRLGFAETLRRVLRADFFRQLEPAAQARIVDAYWQGIRRVHPAPFDPSGDYCLLKTIGAGVMNEVLPAVLERLRARGAPLDDPASYVPLLDAALGEALVLAAPDGSELRGLDVWRVGPAGAAGAFGGHAGRRKLAARIEALLPPH